MSSTRIEPNLRKRLGILAVAFIPLACSSTPAQTDFAAAHHRGSVHSNTPSADEDEPQTSATLYERLGGYDAVSAVVDVFAQKLFDDPIVGKRFFGMSEDSRQGFRQKNKNLVCSVTGGPCKIISRPADVTHAGLGIKASEFDIVVGHLVSTLEGFDVPDKEQQELLAIIGTLRPSIVEVEDR